MSLARIAILICFIVAATAAGPERAFEACSLEAEKPCDVRKFSWCGPIELAFWVSKQGKRHCDKAKVALTPTDVMPNLRRIRCYFYGDTAEDRFEANNYVAISGPKPGEHIQVRHGVGEAVIHGSYRDQGEDSEIFFQNVGPGTSVVLKCNGYGPG